MGGWIKIAGHDDTKTSIKVPKVASAFIGSLTFVHDAPELPAYTGQFGFDFMDFKKLKYQKIVGKNIYDKTTEMYTFNSGSSNDEFTKLEAQYDTFELADYDNGNDRKKTTYYTPWYSSFKAKPHKLLVQLNIKSPEAGEIKLVSSDANLKIDKPSIKTTKETDGEHRLPIEISFENALKNNAKIEARFYDDTGKNPDGLLIGALNVYKNDVEYDMRLKFLKVYITGKIKVQGEEGLVYLDPIKKEYKYYINLIDKTISEIGILNDSIRKMDEWFDPIHKPSPLTHNFARNLAQYNSLNNERDTKSETLTKTMKKLTLAKDIDANQEANLKKAQRTISRKTNFLKKVFGQALVNYHNIATEEVAIEAQSYKEYLDFTDDISVYKSDGGYKIKYTEGASYDTGEFSEHTFDAYTNIHKDENYIFMIPFDMHSSKSEISTLLGQAEAVSYKGNKAIMLPSADANTIIHEIGHVFNLSHTFSNDHVNFCQGTLNNIMDYAGYAINTPTDVIPSGSSPIPKFTFFKWQWEIIAKDPNLIKKSV